MKNLDFSIRNFFFGNLQHRRHKNAGQSPAWDLLVTHKWKYLISHVSSLANFSVFSSGPKTSFFVENQHLFCCETGNFFTGQPVIIFSV